MKKFFWLGCAAVALLASCSQDETVETPSSKVISFGNTFVDNATRSVDPGIRHRIYRKISMCTVTRKRARFSQGMR